MQIPIARKNDTVEVGKSDEKWQKTRVRNGRDLVFLVDLVLVLVVNPMHLYNYIYFDVMCVDIMHLKSRSQFLPH